MAVLGRYIVRMLSHFVHKKHLCIVFEILHCNLYDLVKRNQVVGVRREQRVGVLTRLPRPVSWFHAIDCATPDEAAVASIR